MMDTDAQTELIALLKLDEKSESIQLKYFSDQTIAASLNIYEIIRYVAKQ